jgi:acyl-CoA hydrolase
MRFKRFARESAVTTSEFVLPNDTNSLHNLMGGKMMHWMDMVAAIAAQRHSNRIVVTASVDNILFKEPVRLGNVVVLEAKVTRSFNSSMEVYIVAYAEDIPAQTKIKANEAFFTFVAVDQGGRPIDVPELIPETAEEIALWEGALQRRQLRLLLAGRIKTEDASVLKQMLEDEIHRK